MRITTYRVLNLILLGVAFQALIHELLQEYLPLGEIAGGKATQEWLPLGTYGEGEALVHHQQNGDEKREMDLTTLTKRFLSLNACQTRTSTLMPALQGP
mmetsp:Transcript_14082/g.22315  ORF Transcript_14082/g.22315 Transcript_14082/m.22315 type:complete len:99 (-) Transcript_14082:1503-1799(-)